jgi:hypothetical protein
MSTPYTVQHMCITSSTSILHGRHVYSWRRHPTQTTPSLHPVPLTLPRNSPPEPLNLLDMKLGARVILVSHSKRMPGKTIAMYSKLFWQRGGEWSLLCTTSGKMAFKHRGVARMLRAAYHIRQECPGGGAWGGKGGRLLRPVDGPYQASGTAADSRQSSPGGVRVEWCAHVARAIISRGGMCPKG